MTRLPGILADVERAAGHDIALQVLSTFGGQTITFSTAADSALVQAVGPEAAAAIVKKVGGGRVTIPMANARGQRARWAVAAQRLAQGATTNEAAAAADVHERTVRRLRARMRKKRSEDGQADLFD